MHIDACSQRISDRVIISWFQTSLGVSVGHIFGVVRNDKEIKAKKDLQGQKDEAFRHARADRFKISFCMPPKFALSSEKNTSIVPARSSNFSNTLAWILTPVLDLPYTRNMTWSTSSIMPSHLHTLVRNTLSEANSSVVIDMHSRTHSSRPCKRPLRPADRNCLKVRHFPTWTHAEKKYVPNLPMNGHALWTWIGCPR